MKNGREDIFRVMRDIGKSEERQISTRRSGTTNRLALQSLSFREEVCSALDVDVDHMPFFGELMRVEDPEWESACEKHMMGQALVMIVPWEYADLMLLHAPRIARERTSTRNIWEVFSVFDVADRVPAQLHSHSSGNLLCDKVSVDEGSPYAEFIRKRLRKKFDFVCCDSPGELLLTSKGVLKNGVSRNGNRFDMDERVFQSHIPNGNMILGRGRNFGVE